jgi:mono/diheme cytochrome c family protein
MMPHAKPWEHCKWPSSGVSNACVTLGSVPSPLSSWWCPCEREQRQFRGAPGATSGGSSEANASAIAEGKRLFERFNCVGCYGHGGGGIGPPLMDGEWIHSSEPATIFTVIVEGSPNGMLSFRGKIPDAQVWQLVAYVRSLSGLVPRDAAPGRSDRMQVKTSAPVPAAARR